MQDYLKNAGLILGHVVCVLILLYCFANTNEIIPEEPKTVHTVELPAMTPTVTVTSIPTVTPTITTFVMPEPTTEPTKAPTPEPTPTVTEIPTPEPTIAATVTPTVTPTLTPTPTVTEIPSPVPTQEPVIDPLTERNTVKQSVQENIASGVYSEIDKTGDSWWFRRKENHVPSGSGEFFDISTYQGIYLDKDATEEDKVIYLTIDCGYGSDNTAVLLDIFKEQNVQVIFFVTSHFLKANPNEVRRMSEEGHLVGNHSVNHLNLTTLTEEQVYSEIIDCEDQYYKLTGKQIDLFFRPPGGKYSRRTMQMTEDLGYMSVFWSIAYNDYDQYNQPGKEYVINHFETYHHNGAIVLMHNDSQSNMEAMRDVILYLKEQGYRFGSLEELRKQRLYVIFCAS